MKSFILCFVSLAKCGTSETEWLPAFRKNQMQVEHKIIWKRNFSQHENTWIKKKNVSMLTWEGVLVTRNSLNSLYSVGTWKCFLKCFALIGQRHTLLFLYFYSVCLSLPVARCAHLRMCVQLCVHAHTHTHTHTHTQRTIPQGFSSIGNLQKLKKGTKSSV